ncbi:uncharacterized protein UHOD_02531 [Ustilago sp. UG-2017b]|nr:uncharacterized protein UHOD_02531 [Ustilago sp. UG-2017b]
MDTEEPPSFVTASAGADPTKSLQQPQSGSPHSRSPSATSTATERPTLHLDHAASYPRKPPSIDSNFSSVQGKTAGTPPDHGDDAEVDQTVSSIWDESQTAKFGQVEPAPATPLASSSQHPVATQQQTPPPISRPDWMTDDLDESWPDEDPATQATPTPSNAQAPASTTAPNEAQQANVQSNRPRSPIRSALPSDALATPSAASRPIRLAAIANDLPDPAFSAARHQARRALLKSRASGVGAPTPRAPAASSINALQAGPSTPSLRLPSHLNRRNRLRGINAENEQGDSTIWSESESESDSAGSAPDDFESARGSLAENSRITNMQTAPQSRSVPQQQTQAQSPTAASDASNAEGTFIHKADVSSLPPILRPVWQSPAKGQNGPNRKGVTALGGDMFTPMRLQTMFKTPTPPEKPTHNIMSVVAGAVNPFTIPEAQTADGKEAPTEQQQPAAPNVEERERESAAPVEEASSTPPQAVAATQAGATTHTGVPSTAFTFQTPHASLDAPLHVARGMVPSQSLHNMQTLHPDMHATALARPASAAADLGLHSPAVAIRAANLLSGPPTPHTPMRLFNFNYDNADTRAKLEKMVNERTPSAAPPQPPTRPAEVERERKRLRLDVKPRKVLTGDLMSMPTLGEPLTSNQQSQPSSKQAAKVEGSNSHRQPVVDYVKESSNFMSALQDAVRIQSGGPDTSPEWATEEEESSGNGVGNQGQVSFHQGRGDRSNSSPATSPARSRRTFVASQRNRFAPQKNSTRDDIVPSALEHGSPQRLSSRRLPPDSSFVTESSSNDIPMSSTLKSRASLSRRIAEQVKAGESPRKLLRRISAAAIAEEEVRQEFDKQEAESGRAWEPAKLAEDAFAYRDQQIRQLEERIAKRRQLSTPAKAVPQVPPSEEEPHAVSRPQLITLHEPTLDAIASRRQAQDIDGSDEESDVDESAIADRDRMQREVDGNTRRFHDGIVLYDSERIPNPPLPDPTRALRNMASAVELRNHEVDRASLACASSLLALPSHAAAAAGVPAEDADLVAIRRGDRTASSNTLVDPSNARTVSGDVGSQPTISDLGGKGATITRTGSLFNISQIPEQEIESLGRGRLTFNKELNRWEKVPRSRSSEEGLRSAAGSRNETVEGGFYQAPPTSKTPIPVIPEASAELSRSIDVFSESAEEQQARAQAGGRTNSFQQRLGNLSQNNLSAADGRQSDSSDPFRGFESFGQSSHAPASVSDVVEEDEESTPKPVKSNMFVSRQQYGANRTPAAAVQADSGPALATNAQAQRETTKSTSPAGAASTPKPTGASPNLLASRILAASTVPKSSSSLRNVVTYSPESTASSRHSSLGHHATDARDELVPDSPDGFRHEAQATAIKRAHDYANVYATPDRRLAHQQHLGTPTRRASASSISTPKSILKQPAAFRGEAPARLKGASHNTSANSAVGGSGTPNRTISFADPPSTAHARGLGLAPSARVKGSVQRAQTILGGEEDEYADDGRTQAISSALKVLADLTLGDDTAVLASVNPSPSKMRDFDANRSHWSYRTLRRPRKTRPEEGEEGDFSCDRAEDTYDELHDYPDMTLLTDASFNFAHDKVLEAITDVEPWEPGWDELQAIDLSRRRLESCVRLKEFLPTLEEVDLQNNELSYLTGIPVSVRVLNVSHNRLTPMASFGHLLHLEELDISNNQIDSLSHLSCLKHLHTLKADNNDISSLDGIDKIRSLVHVSLSGNRLEGIHLATTQWAGLETLDASHNQLISIRGLHMKHRLKSLNLDHNDLNMVDLTPAMPRLRVLRVSGNPRLQVLDVAPAKRLRTLYADYCDLDRIQNLDQLEHLDNLSMRQQADAAIVWPADQLRDVRRLFLSGNAFPQGISTTITPVEPRKSLVSAPISVVQPLRFLNLVYLELSACQLMHLPEDLAEMAPNLRSLNLDHNLISTLPSLSGMQRLKRLSLVGCRVKKSKSIITAVRGLTELQVLDCRTNPCTLGLYAPLIAPSATPLYRGAEDGIPNLDSLAPSWLPPVPNAQIVQPDQAARQRWLAVQAQKEQVELLEKSHFHKRRPPLADYAIDPNATLAKEALEKETARRTGVDGGASYSSLFLAADARFVKTLPRQFYERRVLHRGLLAMACPKLNWVDGLMVEEEEVEEADRLVSSRRFDREPVAS